MKKIMMILTGLVLALNISASARAVTLNFDSATNAPAATISPNYEGFNFNNEIAVWANYYSSSLLPNGINAATSGDYFAFNNWTGNPLILTKTTAFNFESVWLTSLKSETDAVHIVGYKADGTTVEDMIKINGTSPTLFSSVNFTNLKKLEFDYDSSNFLAMDDLSYSNYTPPEPPASAPTPEPSSMILGLMGLGSMLGLRKRK